MTASSLTPRVRKTGDGLQLSYGLPHRIHDVRTYPRRAPNGSSVILYGHETGIRVIWRGGRTFKSQAEHQQQQQQRQQKQQKQQQSTSSWASQDEEIMILDSDDDEAEKDNTPSASAQQQQQQGSASAQPTYTPPTFTDLEDEIDPAEPYEQIIRQIDLRTGVKVLKISLPTFVPEEEYLLPLDICPPIISKMIVVAAICADSTVRLFSLPLAPPMPHTTSDEEMGVQSLIIPDGSVQNVPAGVALTLTSHSDVVVTSEEGRRGSRPSTRSGGGGSMRGRSQSRSAASAKGSSGGGGGGDDEDQQMHDFPTSTAKQPREPAAEAWDVLLAVHTAQFGGLLNVYRVPIIAPPAFQGEGGLFTFSQAGAVLVQKQYLCAPIKTIAFNPMAYPRKQHGRLLIAHADRVKVFQCLTPQPAISLPNTTDRTSIDGDGNQNDDAIAENEPDFIDEGQWLLTLHLSRTKPPSRKIIDAKWVFGGKGIMVLLTDGTWGIWCIERLYLSHSTSSDKRAQKINLASFTLTGRVAADTAAIATAAGADAIRHQRQHAAAPSTLRPASLGGTQQPQSQSHPQPQPQQLQPQPQPQQGQLQMRQVQSISSSPGFTPMTPSTRKTRQGTLFQGSSTTTHSTAGQNTMAQSSEHTTQEQMQGEEGVAGDSGSEDGNASTTTMSATFNSSLLSPAPKMHGGIAVHSLPSMKSEVPDEEVLIWHAGKTSRIPDLLSLLKNVDDDRGTEASSSSEGAVAVPLHLQNQLQTGAGLLPATSLRRAIDSDAPPEVVVATEYQLIIKPAIIDEEAEDLAREAREKEMSRRDQEKLRMGQLDLEGVNRVMAAMQRQAMAAM